MLSGNNNLVNCACPFLYVAVLADLMVEVEWMKLIAFTHCLIILNAIMHIPMQGKMCLQGNKTAAIEGFDAEDQIRK